MGILSLMKLELNQLQNTRLAISRYFRDIFNKLGGFKFVETLVVTFVNPADNKQNLE